MKIDSHSENLSLVEDIYPASQLQIGMLFESSMQEDNTYHEVFFYSFKLAFNLEKFCKIWTDLVANHAVLRAKFLPSDNGYNCIINKKIDIQHCHYVDCSTQELMEKERFNPLDCTQAGLFRLLTNSTSEQKSFELIFSYHHSILDGWSVALLINEFISAYRYNSPLTSPTTLSYAQFIKIEREIIANENNSIFWKNYLEDTTIPIVQWKTNNHQSINGLYNVSIKLEKIYSVQLYELIKRYNVSIDSLFLYVYFVTLSQFLNQNDVVIGVTLNNRLEKNGGDKLLGLFLNVLPYRLDVSKFFNNCEHGLNAVFNEKLKLYDYKYFPYSKIKMLFGYDLYHFAFNFLDLSLFQEEKEDCFINDGGIYGKTNIPFVLNVVRKNNDNFYFNIVAKDNFIDNSYLSYFGNYFKKNLIALANGADGVGQLSKSDYQTQIFNWNQTDANYPYKKTIHQLFEEQVLRTPNNIALVYESTQFTYQELNDQANQLAHYLRLNYAIQGDDLCAICLAQSSEILVVILGILKSGAAYIPIDPACPEERIKYILDETKAKLLITQTKGEIFLKKNSLTLPLLNINSENLKSELSKHPKINLTKIVNSNNLAYVIYTSGTEGTPKGVMIEHSSVINYMTNIHTLNLLSRVDIVDFSGSLAFDLTVTTSLGALCVGAEIIAYPGKFQDVDAYIAHLLKNKITVIKLVPSYFELLIDFLPTTSIQKIILGGEKLGISVIQKLKNVYASNCRSLPEIYDEYGPTEATVGTCVHKIEEGKELSIGKPYANYRTYVLSHNFSPLPCGAIGELYIGGIGLARGYLNQPALTEKNFILNPFQTESEKNEGKNSRLYKTGDLVRYLSDGSIVFIGRKDSQIKLRGFRIEVGEIESQLLAFPGITRAVVLLHQDNSENSTISNNQYLVGYYVADKPLKDTDLLIYLAQYLPEYMLPSILIQLEKLPLTMNGKLNRKALPHPALLIKDSYVPPQNEKEQLVCSIFSEVLQLPINKIGIHDDFFRIGGNSILAIRAAHSISKNFNINLSVAEIFRTKTIEKLVKLTETIKAKNIIIPIAEGLKHCPLSFAQERLWFIELYEQGTHIYHMPMLVKLTEKVSVESLTQAIQGIASRHEILRTVFIRNEIEEDYQLVQHAPLEIKKIHCETLDEYEKIVKKDINEPFNLQKNYPIRVCLYMVGQIKIDCYLLINLHHIASDGWSIDILQKELLAYYHYYDRNIPLSLPILTIQYKDFAVWQRNYLVNDKLNEQLAYWTTRLAGYEPLYLPTDKKRPVEVNYEGSTVAFNLPLELSSHLKAISQTKGYTLYTILLAGFYILLYKYSGQKDIIVGSATANRHHEPIKDLIGFFINILVQREQLDINQPVSHLFEKIHQHLIEAQSYQDIPFEKIVQELLIERDTSRHPLFQVMFSTQNFGQKITEQLNELFSATSINELYKITRVDLECMINESGAIIKGVIVYATHLYNNTTIQRMVNHYILILEQIVDEQNKPLRDYRSLSSGEFQKIIYDWNLTGYRYHNHKTISQLFEEQVNSTPNNIAIIYEGNTMTYAELNQRANQFGHYLRTAFAIQGNDLIILCLNHSEKILIAILGILKAGAAYVPIDPNYPDERIRYILEEVKPKVIFSHEMYLDKLKNVTKSEIINIDENNWLTPTINSHIKNLPCIIESNNLAYVIYTSGTAGKPKGVMIEHHSVINYIANVRFFNLINDRDIVDFSTNIGFDLTVTTTLGALCIGAKVAVFYHSLYELDAYKKHLSTHQISIIKLVPSYFDLLIDYLPHTKIKKVILGGEKLNVNTINRLQEISSYQLSDLKIYDEYGPTETTVGVCINDGELGVSIGTPYKNCTTYVLSSDLNPLPLGAIGELFIGGEGVARGYLNQEDLTAEKFIINPFQSVEEKIASKNARLYRTGDLVRYLINGKIEYIGRDDFQVKINGYRIELTEIENQLLLFPGIKQAVVVVFEKSDGHDKHYIVAYYVSDKSFEPNVIKLHLRNFLPEYMMPTRFIHIESFPLTQHGKLDRNALPSPESQWLDVSAYTAPRTTLEYQICKIYAEILGLCHEKISIEDDFFQLGGDSISSIRLVIKLNKILGFNVSIKDIFNYKTIKKFYDNVAVFLQESRNENADNLLSQENSEHKLLPFQYRALVQLNNRLGNSNKIKLDLYMIHPGMCDCDPYLDLAYALEENYLCYGVDNYNLHHRKKFTTLETLAKSYVDLIQKKLPVNHESEVLLLGWSFGGLIAIAMAGILEQAGYTQITIHLLDTVIVDKRLQDIESKKTKQGLKKSLNKYFEKSYVSKIIKNYDIERKISHESNLAKLFHSKIVLYKALEKNDTLNSEVDNLSYNYVQKLTYNNVDAVVDRLEQIKLVKVNNAHHQNILTVIKEWLDIKSL